MKDCPNKISFISGDSDFAEEQGKTQNGTKTNNQMQKGHQPCLLGFKGNISSVSLFSKALEDLKCFSLPRHGELLISWLIQKFLSYLSLMQ